MPHSDFDVVTGPSMPQLRTPAPQPPNRSAVSGTQSALEAKPRLKRHGRRTAREPAHDTEPASQL